MKNPQRGTTPAGNGPAENGPDENEPAENGAAIAEGRIDGSAGSPDQATVDLDRRARCGFGEVIYGEGKSPELIRQIATLQRRAGQTVLATRIEPEIGQVLASEWDDAVHNPLARTLRIDPDAFDPASFADGVPHVALITAGSTDAAVAEEAAETLTWMRIPHRRFGDIGVAGPHRLASRIDAIAAATVVVVVAGMEGALPSVVAGYVDSPVIAVPTSVGYGANLGGITPLLSAMASCSAGVMTVGIDAGFKGGYCAGLILSKLSRVAAATDGSPVSLGGSTVSLGGSTADPSGTSR